MTYYLLLVFAVTLVVSCLWFHLHNSS